MSRRETVTSSITIQLFGSMVIRVNGIPLPSLRSRKGMWLVALLALRARQEVSRDWLAVTLWPDSEDPLSTFRRTLTDLRQSLGIDANIIETLPGRQIRLSLPDEAIDVLKFDRLIEQQEWEALAEAVSLYQGSLLQECQEEWIVADREARLGAFLRATERCATLAVERHQPFEAVEYLRAALQAAPLQESLYCTLMLALVQCERPSEALLEYHQLRQRLRRELNAEPSAVTVACYRQILSEGKQRTQSKEAVSESSTHAIPDNFSVPHPLTELIGREEELQSIERSFARSRLVTLTGSGGIGKTRLAIAVAQNLFPSFPDGIWFVELARITDPNLIAPSIATILKVRDTAEGTILDSMVDFLRSRTSLLILDNCEHLIDQCSQTVESLLQRCHHLSILTTSRQHLGVPGEVRLSIPPLSVSDHLNSDTGVDPFDTNNPTSAAVRLFVERAITALPTFRVTPDNLPVIRQLCVLLEGIPLAIEMASVRLKVMSLEQISMRLTDRFNLLTAGNRSGLAHHQTLRSLIDWSYDLLSAPERVLLKRLAVFVGGWTLESAEMVCAEQRFNLITDMSSDREILPQPLVQEDVLDLMGQLIEKSLVQSEEEVNGERRFRMLETLREYAYERLQDTDETLMVKRKHCQWFASFASEAHSHMHDKEQRFWLELLDREYDNIRSALIFCQQDLEGGVPGLQLATSLGDFWWIRGYLREGRSFIDVALSHPGAQQSLAKRAQAMSIAGVLATHQGDYSGAERLLQSSLSLQRSQGDKRQIAIVLDNLGSLYREVGKFEQSQVCLEESLSLFQETNLPSQAVISLTNLGSTAFQRGDYILARKCYEEAVNLRRVLGNARGVAIAQCGLGQVLLKLGEIEFAYSCLVEAEQIFRDVNDRANLAITLHSIGVLFSLRREFDVARKSVLEALEVCRDIEDVLNVVLLKALAEIYQESENWHMASRIIGTALAYAENHAMNLTDSELEAVATTRLELCKQLGEEAFEAEWEVGRCMSLDEVITQSHQSI